MTFCFHLSTLFIFFRLLHLLYLIRLDTNTLYVTCFHHNIRFKIYHRQATESTEVSTGRRSENDFLILCEKLNLLLIMKIIPSGERLTEFKIIKTLPD